jgi:putative transposase
MRKIKKRKPRLATDKMEDEETTPKPEPEAAPISSELLDELIVAAGGPGAVAGPNGLLRRLTAALVNRALEAEMSAHVGFERGARPPDDEGNRRNGHREKTLRSDRGPIEVEVPRDRAGSFEPKIVPKHKRAFDGFDDQILALYSRGMTTRDIQGHLREIYGVDVDASLVSRVTDAVIDELKEWQGRSLDAVYPIVYVDALFVKTRENGVVENRACYIVMGMDLDGRKEVLGLWIQRSEGAKFWLSIFGDLKVRGVKDILILCADGLEGMAEAVEAAFPTTVFQTCIVHLIRASTRYVSYKDRRTVCADLRTLYTAENVDAARLALEIVEEKWGKKFPHVARSWKARFDEWTPFLQYPPELRRAIYTTNAIEALNRGLRKALKTRGPLPTDEATLKLVYLAMKNIRKKAGVYRDWALVRGQLAILFDGRFPD